MINQLITTLLKGGLLLLLYLITITSSSISINVYIVAIFSVATLLLAPTSKYFDKTALWLFIFSVTYFLIGYGNNIVISQFQHLCHLISPIAFYCFGKYIVDKLNNKDHIAIFILLTILLFPIITYQTLFKDIINNGFINIMRVLDDDNAKAATILGTNISLGMIGVSVFLSGYNNKKINISTIFLLVNIVSLICVTHLINRSGLILVCIVTFLSIIYIYKSNAYKILLFTIILLIIISLFASTGIINEDLILAYEQRNEYDIDNQAGAFGGRSIRWLFSIEHLFTHPTGWSTENWSFNPFAHNLLLDIARDCGIFPFIAILIATIISVKNLLYIFKQKATFFNVILYAITITFIISSFVEPILQGIPLYMYLLCMQFGINKQCINNQLCNSTENIH